MRPTRMRPETINSWDRGRDQDQLLWDRDRDQKKWSTLTSLQTIVEKVYVWLVRPRHLVSER